MLNNRRLQYLILGITFVAVIVVVVVMLRRFAEVQEQKKAPASAVSNTTPTTDEAVLAAVGKHIVLPYEKAKIVTIANVEDLKKQQPFFTQAKNGDKLLVYSSKVILYDPALDKIIDVAQIRIDTSPTPTK